MKLFKGLLVAVAILIAAVVGGAVVAGIYGRLKYPHVAIEETDVFFDIGLVFYLGFAAVLVVAMVACVLQFRRRRAR